MRLFKGPKVAVATIEAPRTARFIAAMFTAAVENRLFVDPRGERASPSIDARTADAQGPRSNTLTKMKVSLRVILLPTPGIQTSARHVTSAIKTRVNFQSSRTDWTVMRYTE